MRHSHVSPERVPGDTLRIYFFKFLPGLFQVFCKKSHATSICRKHGISFSVSVERVPGDTPGDTLWLGEIMVSCHELDVFAGADGYAGHRIFGRHGVDAGTFLHQLLETAEK